MSTSRIARPGFLVLLALVAIWGGIATWRRATKATQVLATTQCPFFGAPRIVINANVASGDSEPARIHEEVHATQCRELGPWRYRWRNLSANGKLELEAPAYCAAAAARLRGGADAARVRDRLIDDMTEAMSDIASSRLVMAALRKNCPTIVTEPSE